jgi:hypothetical protein
MSIYKYYLIKITIFAVVDGFEPPSGDSTDNMTLASWWSTP